MSLLGTPLIEMRLLVDRSRGIEPVRFIEELLSCTPDEAVDLLTNFGEDVLDRFYGESEE